MAGRRALMLVSTVWPALATCGSPSPDRISSVAPASQPAPVASHHEHPVLDGRGFPDHVLALTWDDGPDAHTLELAKYLAGHHIAATFFVVRDWVSDLSDEPGRGQHVFETGYGSIPILGDLVALGHRLGNHTAHHVVLSGKASALVNGELRDNQTSVDPYLKNELRLLRVPGGAWDDALGQIVDDDPALTDLVGPIRWDIDRKDWEGSLYCSGDPRTDCEAKAPGGASRVRASVTAARYLETISQAGHGIVLFHDRVGDVGSDYALRVAHEVIPALEARGFVFAAPVLAFGAWRSRAKDSPTAEWVASIDPTSVTFVDVDGDGRADLCGQGKGGFGCARSVEAAPGSLDRRPVTVFAWDAAFAADREKRGTPVARDEGAALKGDLNGDGRPDACTWTAEGASCALSAEHSALGPSLWLPRSRADFAAWSQETALDPPRMVLADVNGDGRADLCGIGGRGVACALAP